MTFLTELATNASAKGVGIIFYSGNDDALVGHRGTEGMRCSYVSTLSLTHLY
jgi:carboxypeptidase D